MGTVKASSIRQCHSFGSISHGCAGFSLIELLVVVGIAAIGLGLAVPSLSKFVATQQLNGAIATLSVLVEQAREAALTTGCEVELSASASSAQVRVDVRVKQTPDVLACSLWFDFNKIQSVQGTVIQTAEIDKATLSSPARLEFESFRGQLSPTSPRTLSMSINEVKALVTFPTLGPPMVAYAY